MAGLYSDIRFALRCLVRNPLLSLVAIASLALGIGANTAIFTLVDQLLLRLLPVQRPEQLVMIWSTGPHLGSNQGPRASSYPMYQDYQKKAEAFSFVFCRFESSVALSTGDQTERVNAELVSGNYFMALGVKPALGRVFTPEEDDRQYKGHPSVVLTHAYWVSRFNSDPSIIGKKLLINSYPMTIVGVSQMGYSGLDPSRAPQIRVPIQMKPIITPGSDNLGDRRSQWIHIFARLKPGFTQKTAQASLQPLFHQILEQELLEKGLTDVTAYNRDRFLKRVVMMEPAATGYSRTRDQVSTALIVLMCMVGMVLAIACFNVANLLIARAVARQKEIAVRLALGASRFQLIRQLLIESLALSVIGGLLGIALAVWAVQALLSFAPADGRMFLLTATPDPRVLSFTLALAVITGLVFGLVPAMQSSRLDVWSTIKDTGGAVTGGSASVKLRKGLVTAQIALSFLLLAGAGLFVKSLANLRSIKTGFEEPDALVTFQIDPARSGYSVERLKALKRQLLEDVHSIPGVKSVGSASMPLLHGFEWDSSMSVEGHMSRDGEDIQAYMNSVSPRYFKTMGIPLIAGRDFDSRDFGERYKAAVINRAFAEHFFGTGSPVGRHIGFGSRASTKLDMEIIGVAENSLYEGPREGVHRQVFVAMAESSFPESAAYYVRAAGSPGPIMDGIRGKVRALDATLPIYEMKTLGKQLDETLSPERLIALLSATFGALATLMAGIGLYGIMAFVVERRSKELGVRIALGARRASVIWLVLSEVLALIAIGLAVGVPSVYLLGRYVASRLSGVRPSDLATAAGAIFVLGLIAVLAGFLPARRASSIDPMQTLRYE